MYTFTKRILAIMIALVVSGTLSAQVSHIDRTPKPVDVSAYGDQIKMKEQSPMKGDREYVTLLEEDFSLMTAGSEQEPDTANLAQMVNGVYTIDPNYTHTPGWMGKYIYQAGGCCYMGYWYQGFIDTPEIEMAGSVHISFRARIQDGNQGMTYISLCVDPINPLPVDLGSFYMTSEWQTYEFDFTNPESTRCFIQINGFKEWFLDDVVISRELDFTPAPLAEEADNYTMDGFDAHWGEVVNAEDYLLTVFKRDFYGPEQVYVAPESFENINNDGQFINWSNPNIPEGWLLNLQAGSTRQVTTDAYDGNLALCMDAVGDTIILPSNGGRFLASTVYLKLLAYNPDNDATQLEFIGKVNGEWQYVGVYIPDWNVYNNGMEWSSTNLFSLWIDNMYDEFGLAYSGEGNTIYALDFWDYTTSQACTMETVYEDIEIAAPNLSYTVTGLNPAEDHYYYLKARNGEFGESVKSNYISCFGLCPPVMREASGIIEGGYTANWEAHPKADAYEIHNYYVMTVETDQPNAVVFSEDFVQVHNGVMPPDYIIDDDPYYHRLDQYTAQPDWYGAGIILAEGMLGAADNEYLYGRLYTPQITLNNAETFHVKATIWGWEGETISITATTTGEVHSFEYAESGLQTLEMDFTAGPESGRERLRFEDRYGYPFLIDNLQVMQDLHIGDKTFNILSWNLIEDGTAESYTYTGLDGYDVEDFAYDLIAIHTAFGDDYESVNSDYAEVTIMVSVEETSSASFSIYPNPTQGNIIINAEGMRHITVLSVLGQVVYETEVKGDEIVLNLSQIDAGIYLLRVTTDSGIITKEVSLMK